MAPDTTTVRPSSAAQGNESKSSARDMVPGGLWRPNMLPALLIMGVFDVESGSPMKNGYDGSKRSTETNTITRVANFEVSTRPLRLSVNSTGLSMLDPDAIAARQATGGVLSAVDLSRS